MAKNELHWKNIVIATPLPAACPRPLSGTVYWIVHLYSGRRREQDQQWFLEISFKSVSQHVHVLSIDTAVDSMCDVNKDSTWGHLCDLARSGRLLALIMGPPCETWSSARHEQLYNAASQVLDLYDLLKGLGDWMDYILKNIDNCRWE